APPRAPVARERPAREPRAVSAPPAAPTIPDRPSAVDIRRVITEQRDALRTCYVALGGGASLRLTLRIVVTPSGVPERVDVGGSGNSPLRECIADRVRRWRFPASRQGVTVSYPIVFRADEPRGPSPAPTPQRQRPQEW
ncbi:MAG: AgmX/PglI C-terminal domain-containing protein, partial [Myxococcales bacterium]|nr:AgmX/PglI C-terminal domain-containing protein [Myxococcales bacterium]